MPQRAAPFRTLRGRRSGERHLAADGRTVAFESDSTNLITGDTNGTQDVFVRGPGVDASTYGYDRLSRSREMERA